MITNIFLSLLGFYFLLSVIYSVLYLPENIAFKLRHIEQNLKHRILHKPIAICKTIFLSMTFGGLILAQNIYRYFSKQYRKVKAWYALAQIAKKLTKNIQDAIEKDQKKES
jgi:hypothetical protein